MLVRPSGHLGRTVRAIEKTEDLIHIIVAILLTALGVALIVYAAYGFKDVFVGPHNDAQTIMVKFLNQTLLLFIVAELLHTVVVAIQHGGALDPEPFIIAGLVAGIRRVLILTAGGEDKFRWNPQGMELLILIALILVMATTALVWRRARQPSDQMRKNQGLDQLTGARQAVNGHARNGRGRPGRSNC